MSARLSLHELDSADLLATGLRRVQQEYIRDLLENLLSGSPNPEEQRLLKDMKRKLHPSKFVHFRAFLDARRLKLEPNQMAALKLTLERLASDWLPYQVEVLKMLIEMISDDLKFLPSQRRVFVRSIERLSTGHQSPKNDHETFAGLEWHSAGLRALRTDRRRMDGMLDDMTMRRPDWNTFRIRI